MFPSRSESSESGVGAALAVSSVYDGMSSSEFFRFPVLFAFGEGFRVGGEIPGFGGDIGFVWTRGGDITGRICCRGDSVRG
jgi:hypothetical protein